MNRQQFLEALEQAIMLDKGALTPTTVLGELDSWDSMAVLEFQAMADEHFDIQVEPEDIGNCKTVDDLCVLVKLGPEG